MIFEVPFFMSIPSPSCGSPSLGMSFRKDPGHSSATLSIPTSSMKPKKKVYKIIITR